MADTRAPHRGKVGLVTYIEYESFGGRLQNYATQCSIAALGFACTTIVNHPRTSVKLRQPAATGAGTSLPRRLVAKLRRQAGFARSADEAAAELKRLRNAKRASGLAFTRAHIRESPFTVFTDTPAEHLDGTYDYFVVGSDQVWNPELRNLAEIDFLTFASKHKRIAFSASMGVSELPREVHEFYRTRLADFAHISVREAAAAEVVRSLTGREVPVTVDPTLMLGQDHWRALARRHPRRPKGDYLLTYFIGPRSDVCQELIDRCAAVFGLSVVHLRDPASEAFYAAGPEEFLDFVQGARLHLTDSFHGVIFSAIFGTPFLSCGRADRYSNMGSRLDTVLSTLQLEHRRFRAGLSDADVRQLLEPDFAHVPAIIDRKTAEARGYLARALNVEPEAARKVDVLRAG